MMSVIYQVILSFTAGACNESEADILVIDDDLHDVDPVTESVDNANHMLVLPYCVSSHSRCL